MSIFKAFQKDRKIGKTPFNLSFQNIFTANFGGLTPVGCYNVIPNDTFKIGTNALTKVEPMPAPAFTRIKQNTYGFFVPNQQIWQHWNDYITNGTAYADTYGNNSNNQDTNNLWRVPQIPANDIQLISKIANGWAIPMWRSKTLQYIISTLYTLLPDNQKVALYYSLHQSDNTGEMPLVDWYNVALTFFVEKDLLPRWFITDIPYIEACTTPEMNEYYYDSTKENPLSYFSACLFYSNIEYGCDYVTCMRIESYWKHMQNQYAEVTKEIYRTKDLNFEETFSNDVSTGNVGFTAHIVALRCFCDNISNDVEKTHAPFILVKKNYRSDATNGKTINYYCFQKNLYKDVVSDKIPVTFQNNNINSVPAFRDCGYFWKMFVNGIRQNTESFSTGVRINLDFFSGFNELFGDYEPSSLLARDSFLSMQLYRNSYNEVVGGELVPYSEFNLAYPPNQSVLFGDGDDYDILRRMHPYYLLDTGGMRSNADINSLISVDGGGYRGVNKCDVELPIYYNGDINSINNSEIWRYSPVSTIYFTFESYNLGFDSFSFMVYLCQNACKLLDYFNIPLEGLTVRSFLNYSGEFIQALPFVAYSKIWNDYFRNKVTSTAELDYREINSNVCLDFTRWAYMCEDYANNSESIKKYPQWIQELLPLGVNNGAALNGWCLPFSCAPKNAVDNIELDVDGQGNKIKISDMNHFHDIRVNSYYAAFSVLTGYALQELAMSQIINYYSIINRRLYGIIADKLYLPSYYNGLLHYKYQNFNKDYFSSALLDPMSGANQEEIGNTVNTLINAEARQGFWNRLAQNRSVAQFWESVFGIKLSHTDYDKPLLLGSKHTDVNIGEVVQLSQSDSTPQGTRSGLGSAHDSGGLFKHTFNEHGYVIILVSHTLELQYMQGLEKMWTPEESFLDFPFIDFVGLGNQSINQRELNFTTRPKFQSSVDWNTSRNLSSSSSVFTASEVLDDDISKIDNSYPSVPKLLAGRLYLPNKSESVQLNLANGSGFNLTDVFGYIPRYSTYKVKLDQCHGEFRNQLMFWHSFRKFFTQPILCHEFVNWEFMSENDELLRMFFVTDESTDKFKVDMFINCTAVRPLPYVCTPKTSI